jgi:hypothetical protein
MTEASDRGAQTTPAPDERQKLYEAAIKYIDSLRQDCRCNHGWFDIEGPLRIAGGPGNTPKRTKLVDGLRYGAVEVVCARQEGFRMPFRILANLQRHDTRVMGWFPMAEPATPPEPAFGDCDHWQRRSVPGAATYINVEVLVNAGNPDSAWCAESSYGPFNTVRETKAGWEAVIDRKWRLVLRKKRGGRPDLGALGNPGRVTFGAKRERDLGW